MGHLKAESYNFGYDAADGTLKTYGFISKMMTFQATDIDIVL